jgi:hypothetical protein
MAGTALAYGERRFGASYALRGFAAFMVLALLGGLWAAASEDPAGVSHSTLTWVSIVLLAALAVAWIAAGKSALIVSDAGVRRESLFGRQEMAWAEITETRYRVIPVNVYAHFGLIGALLAMSSKSSKSSRAQLALTLLSSDGSKKLKVTSSFRHADEAIGIILERILPPKVQSVKARLQRGETVRFGGLGLSATAVTWKKDSIPVSQITKAELAGSNLQIKRQGKWMSAVSVRSDKVPDVLVFLEVLESLAPQVKASGFDPLARVRM